MAVPPQEAPIPERPAPPADGDRSTGGAAARDGGAAAASGAAVPLPVHLLVDVPALPFDVYVRRAGELVLYASRGNPCQSLLRRAMSGLAAFVRPADSGLLVRLHLAAVARAVELEVEPPAERGGAAVRSVAALLALAGREVATRPPGDDGGSVGWPPTAGLAVAPPAPPIGGGAVAALVAAASLAADGLTNPAFRRGWLSALTGAARRREPLVGRTVDGIAYAVGVAERLGFPRSARSDLAKAMAVRDLAVVGRAGPRLAGSRDPIAGTASGVPGWTAPRARSGPRWPTGGARLDRQNWRTHPLEGARLVAIALGCRPSWGRAVVEHHERPDGSGFPGGVTGEALSPLGAVAALADAFAGLCPSEAAPARLPAAEVLRLVRFVLGPRFPATLLVALGDLIAADDDRPYRPS